MSDNPWSRKFSTLAAIVVGVGLFIAFVLYAPPEVRRELERLADKYLPFLSGLWK